MIQSCVVAFVKRFGGTEAKQRVWDAEFAKGKWDYLQETVAGPLDPVLDAIERYCAGGDVLDLGCGTGRTGLEISDTYRSYLGVDISEVAVCRATETLRQDGRRLLKNRYVAADIAAFEADRLFSVILFRESLYYFPVRTAYKLLERYSSSLSSSGVFIVRIHDAHRHTSLVRLIERSFVIAENNSISGSARILVFRPSAKDRAS